MSPSPRSPRSRAHDFSALSTSIGVALTLALLGALVSGAILVRQLRSEWMTALAVQVVLDEVPNSQKDVESWLARFMDATGVAHVRYVDPESAAQALESELGEPFMEFLGESPLPAVVEVQLDRDWMEGEGLIGLDREVAGWTEWAGVVRVEYPKALLERMEKGFEEWTVPGLVLVLVLMSIVIAQILNVVRLSVFGHRFLIRSMELVGAPPYRVRRPFVLEAMGYGFVGALLAYAGVVLGLGFVRPFLSTTLGTWGLEELGTVLLSQLTVGLLLTGLSARWAVGRYCGARLDRLV